MIAPNNVFVRKAYRTPLFIANRSWAAKMLKSDRLLGLFDGAFIFPFLGKKKEKIIKSVHDSLEDQRVLRNASNML